MSRHQYNPKVSEGEVRNKQRAFQSGMMQGPPASLLPDNALYRLFNVVSYSRWLQGRFGSRIYTDTVLPGIPGRSGYSGSKTGTLLTSVNAGFTEGDVFNYWVWDDGTQSEMIEYVSATQMRTRDSDDNTGSNCYVRGRHNGWFYHSTQNLVVIMLAGDFWVSDVPLTSWSRMTCISASQPQSAISTFDEFDDDVICWNSGGMFRLKIGDVCPHYWRMNSPSPSIYVTGNTRDDTVPYGYRYLYTAVRLSGYGAIKSRADSGVLIEQESCPNQPDDDLKDYGEVWTALPRGNNTKTHGVITGEEVALASRDAVTVWEPVVNGALTLTINGNTYTAYCDFTSVQTMGEVAQRIQNGLRVYWPDATCEYESNVFTITSGYVDGSTLTAIAAPGAGTNITAAGYMNIIGGTISTEYFAQPKIVQGFTVPVQSASPSDPEWHYTHYGVYRTLDVGDGGTNPITGEGNDPERYIWCKDLRMSGAFLASKTTTGVVTASIGEFEEADVGTVIEWYEGTRDLITSYVSSTQVIVDEGGEYYYEEPIEGPCAIGNGRVIGASQSGTTVTRTIGGSFSSGDVGKTIVWADGYTSIITGYINANKVTVCPSQDREYQGMTLDWTGRNLQDTIDDDNLRPRQRSWLIKNRAWDVLPLTNIGRYMPGWVFSAVRGESKFYYTQLAAATKYLAGYYNPLQENDDCKDAIQSIEEYPNRIVIFCTNSVYGGPTNTSVQISVPGTGEFINVFSGIQLLAESVGVTDYGSIVNVNEGMQLMITGEPAVRMFDGFKFGDNLAETREGLELVMNYLRGWQAATAAAYKDGELFFWGLRK